MESPQDAAEDRPGVHNESGPITAELPPPEHPSLAALISASAARFASQKAFTSCMPNGMNGALSYAQVNEASDAFAVYLREGLGLAPGSRVAVQLPNCLSYPVAVFGILKAGCVLVNTNPLYTASEMTQQFRDSGAEALVIVDLFVDKLPEVLPRTAIRHVVVTSLAQFFPPVVRQVVKAVLKYWNRVIPPCRIEATPIGQALAEGKRLRQARGVEVAGYWRELGPDSLAALQYTGGTTGIAKGAMLSHGNLLANVAQIEAMAGSHISDGEECVLTALPLYHIFAFSVNLLAFFKHGAHNVLVPNPRPIQNLQRAIENFPISWISGVNTLFNALLNEEWFTLYPPRRLRAAAAGGTALHAAVAERWEKVTGTPLVEGYGLTESSPVVSFNPLVGLRKPGSIGILVPGTEVRLVDSHGQPVARGEPGELTVRGPQVMQGYWQQPEATAQALRDGWLYTGDVATMDEDGYLRIVDRKKDLILVSGFNVYPNEVEDCIALLDAVHEVGVIGVPDPDTGEAVRAYIVTRGELDRDTVKAHCREHLARYKVPKQIAFVDDLPKSPIGKVLRKDLRAEYLKDHPDATTAGSPAC
ncbi:AMP-binding protein [Halomonas campisalis]|uniref:Long-chain-fatty-acid--CoA ligase n=1 Tax=Billgrantia campisalis TaxID=74661 RepID=A0ABS9PCW8_9GAMM|nr:AMP-binding protein [Halomonas campisalis]MCG6659571.1 AMP-binding protein [Halomonas campisalis]MDR5864531.1 AMP-binding protein [Halomonas campisalis]